MQNKGLIRLFSVFIICFSIIFYNAGKRLKIEKKEFPVSINLKEEITKDEPEETKNATEKTQENIEINPVTEEKKEEEKTQNTPQTQAVAAEAVKGKIIEKYISPYNASNSFDKVYLKNNTSQNINLKDFLYAPLSFKIGSNEEPQVLIMHTHTTETFMAEESNYYTENFSSRSTDNSKNMAEIGRIVEEKLNSAGIKTLHDTTQHDYPNYTGSYSRSAKTVNNYLKKYPSIKIVLDLHRDAVSSGESDKVKLATEINGKKAAQVMLVMGSQSETVTNFPHWQENLKLAVKLQQVMEENYPTLARPILLVSKNYNQSLSKGSLLLEFGTDANTLAEACYSAELVGESLVKLLNNLKG